MRVVLVTDSFYPREGGAERQLRQVCAELVKTAGWEVVVVAHRLAGVPAHERIDGLTVERCGLPAGGHVRTAWASFLSALKLARLRPDAVIALQVGSSAAAAIAGSLLLGRRRPPVVIRLTGGSAAGSELAVRAASSRARPIVSAILQFSDTVVAPAHHLLDEPGPWAGVLRTKGVMIPNGVDTQHDTSATGNRVVWMGRPDPVKGFDTFVALARDCPDLRFLAIGPPPVAGLPLNLECTGWVTDPRALLSTGAVFVSTSRFEGSPNSALQALSHGIPVIAWDIPAYRELALEAGDGVALVPVDDLSALVAHVHKAMKMRQPSPASDKNNPRFPVPTLGEVAAQWRDLLERQSSALRAPSSDAPSLVASRKSRSSCTEPDGCEQ